jgi:membrane fusion protein, multidrug efflux system
VKIAFAVVLVLAIAAWAGVRESRQPIQPTSTGRIGAPPIPVVATLAYKGNIGVHFKGLGTVTPLCTVTVKSRVDGQVMKVFYKEGQSVRRGDALLGIDPRPYQVQLSQAEGQLTKDLAGCRTHS